MMAIGKGDRHILKSLLFLNCMEIWNSVSNSHKQNKDQFWAKLISFPSISAAHSIYYRRCYNEQSVPRETIRFPEPKIWNILHSFLLLTGTFRIFVQQRVHSWKEWRIKQRRFQEAMLYFKFNTFNFRQNNCFYSYNRNIQKKKDMNLPLSFGRIYFFKDVSKNCSIFICIAIWNFTTNYMMLQVLNRSR